jgi:site-specific DNA recombinase
MEDRKMNTKWNGMKTVIYARVSSEKQAEKDLSIPAQLKTLRKYALERSWEIVSEYVDEAESAKSANRPAFQEMIAAAKRKDKPFDSILVWKLSRFARNREDSIIYKSLLRKRGISVISINEKIDDSASGRLLEGMIEVIDEFYSANLAQDTMRGMKENISRGFFNGGNVPFGYRKVKVPVNGSQKTKLEPNEAEAQIVKRAFQMSLKGKGGKEIARVFNEEGLRTRSGKLLGTTTINFWLKNPAYTGSLVWNRTDRTSDKPFRKPAAETIVVPDTHKGIVSQADFDRVQTLLADRRPFIRPPRGVSSPYVLSGLAHCSKCGAAMIGTAAKSGKYLYYECDARFKKGKDSCVGLRFRKEMVENFVLDKIRQNILTKENLTKLVHLINGELLETASRLEKQLEQTEKELTKISGKLTKLYVALESGKLDMDDLAPRIKELRAYQHELQQQRDSLIARIESDEPEKLDENEVMSYVNELEQVLGEKSFLQQKTFLRRFVKRVEINPKGFVMDYTIPVPVDNNRTSTREVLYINKDGSAYRIRTGDLLLEREVS